MNYLAHAHQFLTRPAFALGTLVPDFLNMVDRQARARRKRALEFLAADSAFISQLAAGVVQHHLDDERFHGNPEFLTLQELLGRQLRDRFPDPRGLRSWFSAHIAIEMLLDWTIAAESPKKRERLYQIMADVNVPTFQTHVETLTGKSLPTFAQRHDFFLRERFLYDYDSDRGLLYRINRILERLGLDPFPDTSVEWIAVARGEVWQRRSGLLGNAAR